MKKEQYICDVCGRQFGDEKKCEQTSPVHFKVTVAIPGKAPRDHVVKIEEPCHTCADKIGLAMVAASEQVRARARIPVQSPAEAYNIYLNGLPADKEPASRRNSAKGVDSSVDSR